MEKKMLSVKLRKSKNCLVNDEIKQEIQDFIDTKNVNYSIKVSYHEEQKGNFWDAETQQFYKWDELQELAETRKDYKLMENSINDNT